jgi:hypothetical protein
MDAVSAPVGELIAMLGSSVADAQRTIDGCVLEHFGAIYDVSVAAFEPLRAIGYQPTWYQISEAAAEISLAVSVKRSAAAAPGARRYEVQGAHVDAAYAARFGYSHRTASSLKVRILPVPPPAALAPPRDGAG